MFLYKHHRVTQRVENNFHKDWEIKHKAEGRLPPMTIEEKKRAIIAMAKEGSTQSGMAEALGMSRSNFCVLLRHLGITMKTRK